MNNAKFIIGIVLGLVLLGGALFTEGRADRMSRLLTSYIGCAAILWAVLGFLALTNEQHASVFRSFKYFVGGSLVGLGIALLTHLFLARASGSSPPIK